MDQLANCLFLPKSSTLFECLYVCVSLAQCSNQITKLNKKLEERLRFQVISLVFWLAYLANQFDTQTITYKKATADKRKQTWPSFLHFSLQSAFSAVWHTHSHCIPLVFILSYNEGEISTNLCISRPFQVCGKE